MESLALIVSLMLFIPIAVGLVAIILSILQRNNPKLRLFAIILTAIVGSTALLGMIQYFILGIVPAFETVVAALFLFIPKSQTGSSLKD
ncbi:MAG: hypothetical protein F2529_02995 [Actinobacteria bacterium]|uniref:Unannotated protein n=1 Tax=freshwater metagenome TaxID=449393 RepID=A0A6J6BUG6_9ZZZZ|nr:hypothetical protein [Actinomycetota bacterium]